MVHLDRWEGTPFVCRVAASSNNHMHSDSKKRRSFLALLFASGDVRRKRKSGSLDFGGSFRGKTIF